MAEEQAQEQTQASHEELITENASEVHEGKGQLRFPINWTQDSGLPILLANHAFVRLQDDSFIVTFGQMELPREAELSDETKARLEKEGIPMQVISRLAITPARMRTIIEIFSRMYDSWERQQSSGSREGLEQ